MAQLFFVGDSITAGAWDEMGGWAARLIADVMAVNMAAMAKGLNFYCLPYNLGISGDTVPDVVARLEGEIASRRKDDSGPIEIVIYMGANDAVYLVDEQRPRFTDPEFEANVGKLIDLATSLAARVSVLGLLPVDDARLDPMPWAPHMACANRYVKPFEDIIARVCGSKNIRFLPLFEAFMALSDWQKLLIDGEHPNSAGHAALADLARPFILGEAFMRYHSW